MLCFLLNITSPTGYGTARHAVTLDAHVKVWLTTISPTPLDPHATLELSTKRQNQVAAGAVWMTINHRHENMIIACAFMKILLDPDKS